MKDENSDRAETHYELGVPDGIFGSTIEVDATNEGLEFGGGYSSLSWAWIDRARKALIASDEEPPSGRESAIP